MFVQALAVLTLAGALATFATLLTLHLLPTGLSPVRDAVSAYGISRYAGLYRAQTLGTAVAAATLAVALATTASNSTLAVVFLTTLAVARAIIGWCPMDAPDAPRTATGRLHDVLAYVAFASASVSGFMIGIAFGSDPARAAFAGAATALGWFTTAASALTVAASAVPLLKPIFGVAERLIYVGMLGLLSVSGVALIAG